MARLAPSIQRPLMHTALHAQGDQVVLIEQLRARPDKAHVAHQDAPELWQLVEAALRRKLSIGVKCALGSASRCVATAGAPTRMLRNLGILKILLCRPTRSDQYKAGPCEVKRTAIAISATGRTRTTAEHKTSSKSNRRFTPIALRCLFQTFIYRQGRSPPEKSLGF